MTTTRHLTKPELPMDSILIPILLFAGLIVLDILAYTHGAESRPSFLDERRR